jgi:hypothetical protein
MLSPHTSTILTCKVPITQCRSRDSIPNTMHSLQVPQAMHFRQVSTMHPRYRQAPCNTHLQHMPSPSSTCQRRSRKPLLCLHDSVQTVNRDLVVRHLDVFLDHH